MKVAVFGAGSWGTTIASVVAQHAQVTLWALEPDVVEHINEYRENPMFLSGVRLHEGLRATTALDEAITSADAAFTAGPSHYLRPVIQRAEPFIESHIPVLRLTKGIEQVSLERPTQLIAEVLTRHDRSRIGVLSGPNIARESRGRTARCHRDRAARRGGCPLDAARRDNAAVSRIHEPGPPGGA